CFSSASLSNVYWLAPSEGVIESRATSSRRPVMTMSFFDEGAAGSADAEGTLVRGSGWAVPAAESAGTGWSEGAGCAAAGENGTTATAALASRNVRIIGAPGSRNVR